MTVRLPPPPKKQVSARVERNVHRRLEHYVELLKAFAASAGEEKDVKDEIDLSYAVREAISAGLDVLLDKFGGWPDTEAGRQAQIDSVRAGRTQPKP